MTLTVSCYDINFNVDRAARLFKDLVDANGGNVLIAAGGYNGWRVGMTSDDAQAARWQGNCHAQNNLDYLHQLFNGWCQGKVGYGMGSWCRSNRITMMLYDADLQSTSKTVRNLFAHDFTNKRTLAVYLISIRCSVARHGLEIALNAYLTIVILVSPTTLHQATDAETMPSLPDLFL
jgi:hypothetical protein